MEFSQHPRVYLLNVGETIAEPFKHRQHLQEHLWRNSDHSFVLSDHDNDDKCNDEAGVTSPKWLLRSQPSGER